MTNPAPHVVWTHRAEGRLAVALARAEGPLAVFAEHRGRINEQLAVAFDADHLIVLDLYVGFRPRTGEYILLVDVCRPNEAGTFIAKLADDARLRREFHAWESCRGHAFSGNGVFMKQTPCPGPGLPECIAALVYQDAQTHIGADRQMTLEESFLSAVRFGAVDPASLAKVFSELFDHLGQVLYQMAKVVEPAGAAIELNWDNVQRRRRPLADSFAGWSDGRIAEVRQEVNAAFPEPFAELLDPVDFLAYVEADLKAGAKPERWLPRLLRGRSHGDLHGRNVLVGFHEGTNEADRPALFDYEHMAVDNLIGWDFVKLETELKIRAYPRVFAEATSLRHFAQTVQAFEQELGEQTENHRRPGTWPAPGGATARERLLTLLLTIRRLAGCHLGERANRSEDWLEEYYFLLACYSVYAVRFVPTQSPHERIGTFVSGGVAAARFAWWRRRSSAIVAPSDSSLSDTVESLIARDYPTWREPLRIAWAWNRGGDAEKIARAHDLLMGLRDRYRHVLAWHYELAFNLTKQDRCEEALAQLVEIGETFQGQLDEDTLSLWGKCHKARGDQFRAAGLRTGSSQAERLTALAEADRAYVEACRRYEQAYGLEHNWFPGINLATLWLMRAALAGELGRLTDREKLRASSVRLAGELQSAAEGWRPRLKDDLVWIVATRGEAALLQSDWRSAGRLLWRRPGAADV